MYALALIAIAIGSLQAAVPLDSPGVRPGPVTLTSTPPDSATAHLDRRRQPRLDRRVFARS